MWNELLTRLESLTEALEELPEASTDAETYLRVELANILASAVRIARALAADENVGKR